jgi:hypothetical protein
MAVNGADARGGAIVFLSCSAMGEVVSMARRRLHLGKSNTSLHSFPHTAWSLKT